MQSSALDKLRDSNRTGEHAAHPLDNAQELLAHTAGATVQPLLGTGG